MRLHLLPFAVLFLGCAAETPDPLPEPEVFDPQGVRVLESMPYGSVQIHFSGEESAPATEAVEISNLQSIMETAGWSLGPSAPLTLMLAWDPLTQHVGIDVQSEDAELSVALSEQVGSVVTDAARPFSFPGTECDGTREETLQLAFASNDDVVLSLVERFTFAAPTPECETSLALLVEDRFEQPRPSSWESVPQLIGEMLAPNLALLGQVDHIEFVRPFATEDLLPTVAVPVVKLALGQSHVCALLGNGQVKCWGKNLGGQTGVPNVGDSTFFSSPQTLQFPAGTRIKDIDAAEQTTCALAETNQLYCWGSVSSEFGRIPGALEFSPVQVTNFSSQDRVSSLSLSTSHVCVIVEEPEIAPTVRCWGENTALQLSPRGVTCDPCSSPQRSQVPAFAEQVQVGSDFTCMLTEAPASEFAENRNVRCWGDNTDGRVGKGRAEATEVHEPTNIPMRVSTLSSASRYSCIISDGDLHCWGNVTNDGPIYEATLDAEAPGNLTSVATSWSHLCVEVASSPPTLFCRGNNGARELGRTTTTTYGAVEGLVPRGWRLRDYALGSGTTCAVIEPDFGIGNQIVKCWGEGRNGELGIPPEEAEDSCYGGFACSATPVVVRGL